ncbi:hypothetical protein SCP_0300090 [Sparassis crispa]|uniref:DUF6593 domain-containing protein n=1 Tax=Sparassis crispa TaxID=139825 RepID=A0A401GDN6_9APHY|nr:hypothetical protein SCP_0300090 [Sparassis crispa]GBE80294.1 hypothetical protein SCP_0300090 [Sparassis crispa]
MATVYGVPYFLEDQSGDLAGSEFVDLYKRISLTVRCTLRSDTHTAYMVYDMTSRGVNRGGLLVPLACLDFGAGHALGTIKVGEKEAVNMSDYLTKLSPLGSSKQRKFVASDGQEYRWKWRSDADDEWTCVNSSGYHVASYSLKPAGEPQYQSSSGCVLTVEESYPHLIGELLASLTIMRHIAKYNL